ncbi:MAG TPA: hypothetical protein VH306_09155 [Gaiellaceae bacterium]|jgi:hypothetical protein
MRRTHRVARNRPAETTGVAGACALLIARAAGVDDPNLIIAIASVIGFMPAAITWGVELVRGRPVESPVVDATA